MKLPPDSSRGARLRRNSLKAKLRSQKCVIGTFLEITSPVVVEELGLAGFDFVVVDREHGAIDWKETGELIRAGDSTDISVMVRVPSSEPTEISLPLDLGAAGLHVPQIVSAAMARQVVRWSKYHPSGERGVQPYVRAASYGAQGTAKYLASANDDIVMVGHIEGKEALADLDAILNVEGLDVAFLGPYDLSQSLGIPGQVKHPRVEKAMKKAIERARKLGKSIGSYCDDVARAIEYRDLGVSYITISADSVFLLSAAQSVVSQLKSS